MLFVAVGRAGFSKRRESKSKWGDRLHRDVEFGIPRYVGSEPRSSPHGHRVWAGLGKVT